MKKISCVLFIGVYLFLAGIEIIGPFIINEKFFFWRAWEFSSFDQNVYTSNAMGFKPHITYSGSVYGDLARILFFTPRPSEIRPQTFITDEYGFRNRPYLGDRDITAVILGTSQVAGTSETQENLVSELLINKYNISAYTYAKGTFQQYWVDNRFKKSPPKFAVLLVQDYELLSTPYLRNIYETDEIVTRKKWSQKEWEEKYMKRKISLNYSNFDTSVKTYSVNRAVFQKAYIFFHDFFPRSMLTHLFSNHGMTYDEKQNMIFPVSDWENPLLGSTSNTMQDIKETIVSLKNTQNLLKQQGTHLIVGIMPSKSYLYRDVYSSIPLNKTAYSVLTEELKKEGIEEISLFELALKKAHAEKKLLYYTDDTHWNAETNKIISKLVYEKIQEIENKPSQ